MSSRETVLARIRAAVAGDAPPPPAPRTYDTEGTLPADEVIELLVDRLVDYKAQVRRITADQLVDAVNSALAGVRSVVIPDGLDPNLAAACGDQQRTVTVDAAAGRLTTAELDHIDAVVTAATIAIAVTGTIILDGSADQGRRAITLVPDTHLVVLRADQVVESVPEALRAVNPTRPLTLISGPSATSDIELQRVEGVHGPRNLHVLIVDGPA